IAALHALRERKPTRLICAVPVASRDAVEKVGRYADEVVALQTPDMFFAVGQFYMTFGQVDDSEVIEILRAAANRPASGPAAGGQP
ncbi:MAG: phosphoribosyltransferase, partial [Casimicrobiaceae bacterium]